MHRSKLSLFYRRLSMVLVPAIAISGALSGCGTEGDTAADGSKPGVMSLFGGSDDKGQTEAVTAEESSDGLYGYRAEFKQLPGDNFMDVVVKDGFIYGSSFSYDLESGEANSMILKLDEKTGETVATFDPSKFVEMAPAKEGYTNGVSISCFDVCPDGRLSALVMAHSVDENYENVKTEVFMVYLNGEGELLSSVSLGDMFTVGGMEYYPQHFMSINENQSMIVVDEEIWLIDGEGQKTGSMKMNGWVNDVIRAENGDIWVLYYDSDDWKVKLSKLDVASMKLAAPESGFPSQAYNAFAGKGNEILTVADGNLWSYDVETKASEKILRFTDVSVVADYVTEVIPQENGNYKVLITDWSADRADLVQLTKTLKSEMPDVIELTLGVFYPDSSLEAAVANFNKSQSDYRVSVRAFVDWDSDQDYNEQMLAFNNCLLNSSELDLVDVAYLDAENYANKGLLQDLTSFLDDSTVLKRDDYFPVALETYNYNGFLASIPYSFNVDTLIVSQDLIGDKNGWTVDEFIDFANAHPDKQLLEYQYRDSVLQILLSQTMDQFLDEEKGECHLDSDEFKKILSFAAQFDGEFDWESASGVSTATKVCNGTMLISEQYFSDMNDIQLVNYMYHDKANYIGYPTVDGTPAHQIQVQNAYSIAANSQHKEGAWKFLEYYLSQSYDNIYFWGTPATKSGLRSRCERELAQAGKDNGSSISFQDGWSYDFHYLTQAEYDQFIDILNHAKLSQYNYNSETLNIVYEEAAPYFEGQKSLDEVCSIMQSRISIYLSEKN